MNILITFIIKVIGTEAVKTLIAVGVNKLLDQSNDGITKELAVTMIDGIAKSKHNPTTLDVFNDAIKVLKNDN